MVPEKTVGEDGIDIKRFMKALDIISFTLAKFSPSHLLLMPSSIWPSWLYSDDQFSTFME